MINNTDPKKKLWNFLSQKGLYSKDYNAFQEQFSTPESQGKLHRFMTEKQVYSKSAEDFSSQFFPPTEKPLSTEEQRQSIIDKYDQQAEEQIGSDPVISQKRDSLQSIYQQRFSQVEEGIAKEVDSYLQDKQDSLQQLLNAEQITEEQANKQLDEARLQKSDEYKQALEEQAKSFDSEYAKELNSLPEVTERIQKIEAERYKNLQETLGAFDQIEHEKGLKIQEEAKKIGRKVATETQGYGYVLANDLVNAALTKAKYGVPQSIKQIDLLSTSNKMEEERKFLASLEGKADDEVVTRTLSAPKGFSPGSLEQGTVAELRAKSEAKLAKETQKIGELIKPIKELEAKIAGEGIKTDLLDVKSWDEFFQTASNIAGEQAVIMPLALLGGSYAMETAEAYYSQVSSLAKAKGITIQEVIEQGLDNPDAAATAGVISGSLDVLGTGKVVNAMRKAVTGTVKKRLAEFGGTTATEFLTEFAQSLTLQTQNNLVSGEKINLRDAVSEGLAGALMGGLLGSSVFLSNPEKTQIVKNVEKELEATTGDLGVQNGLDNSTDSTITEDNLNHERGQEPTTARAEEEVDTDGQRDTAEQEPVNGDQPQATDAVEENGVDGQTEQPTIAESETVGEPINTTEQGQPINEGELEVSKNPTYSIEQNESQGLTYTGKSIPLQKNKAGEETIPSVNLQDEIAQELDVKRSDLVFSNLDSGGIGVFIKEGGEKGYKSESVLPPVGQSEVFTKLGQSDDVNAKSPSNKLAMEAKKTPAPPKPAQSLAQTENSAVNLPTKGAAITAKPSVKVQPEQLKAASEKISAASQKIQEILKKQRGQLSANPFTDPELLKAVGELAVGLVEMGYLKTKEFTQALSESLGFEVEEQQAKDFLRQARITTGIDEDNSSDTNDGVNGGTIDDTANSKTGRERSGSKTIRDNTTPEARKTLNKNKPFFRTVGREETLEESAKFIDDNGGLEATKDLLMSKDAKIDDEVRFGSLFLVYKHYADKLKQAIEEGSPSDAIAETLQSIRDYLAKEGTHAGRRIDLFNLFKMDGAEGVIHMQNKKAKKHNSKPKNKKKSDGLDKASEEVVSEYQEAINKAVDEVFKKSSVAKATKVASKRSQTKDKLAKIKAKRDKIHKDYKESDLFYSSVVPFKPEFITYVSKLAATYVEEGYVRASDIAARIAEDIKEKFNKDIDLETISGIVQDSLEALNESQRKAIDEAIKSGNFDPKPLINKAAKDLETSLRKIAGYDSNALSESKDKLIEKIMSGLGDSQNTELKSLLSEAFDQAIKENQNKEIESFFRSRIFNPKTKEEVLNSFFEKIQRVINAGALPQFTESISEKSLQKVIDYLPETLRAIAKKTKGDRLKHGVAIVNEALSRLGLTPEQVNLLSGEITRQYEKQIKEEQTKILEQYFKERIAPHPDNVLKNFYARMSGLINSGATKRSDRLTNISNKILSKALKHAEQKIRDIVRNNQTDKIDIDSIIEEAVANLDIDENQRPIISEALKQTYNALIQQEKSKFVEDYFRERKVKEQTKEEKANSFYGKISSLINAGALNKFKSKLSEKVLKQALSNLETSVSKLVNKQSEGIDLEAVSEESVSNLDITKEQKAELKEEVKKTLSTAMQEYRVEMVNREIERLEKEPEERSEKSIEDRFFNKAANLIKGGAEKNSELMSKIARRLIEKTAKDLEIDLQQVIRSHFLGQFKTRDTLVNRIVSQLDLDPETAKRVAAIVEKELASTISSMQDKALQKLLGLDENNQKKEVKPKEKKQYLDKMIELINLGVFSREEFKNAFAEKFGLLPEITNSDAIKIENLIKLIEETESGSKASTLAKLEFVRLLQKYEMAQNWADVSHEVIITNLLSGWTTDVQNTKFNMYSIFFKYAVLPIFQGKAWKKSYMASVKNGSIKGFLKTNPIIQAALMERAAFKAVTNMGVFSKNPSKAWAGFMDTIINGGVDSKFFDEHTDPRGFHLPNIDKDPKAQHPIYKNWKIPVTKNFSIPINPIRAFQFRTRTLPAMDIFSRSVAEEMMFTQYFLEEQQNSKNPSIRKAWSKAVREGVDMDQVEAETKEQVGLLTKYGVKVSKYAEKVIRDEIIESKLGIPQDEIQELKEVSRDITATMERTGFFPKLANKAIQASNYGSQMNHPMAQFGSKLLINVFFPFKKIIGQIGDIMLDSVPVYNYARTYGYGVTGLKRRLELQSELGRRQAWSRKTFAENTSQMGEVGSRKFNNQMALAHLHNTMMVGLAALFLGTDEEDYFYISGGYHNLSFSERELQNKNGVPANTIKIGGLQFNYLNTPLHIAASVIGNWNDGMKSPDWDEDGFIKRSALVGLYSMNSIKDVSIFSGIQDFTDFTATALELLDSDSRIPENALEEKSSAATKVVKPIVSYLSKTLPWNNNGILQVKKMFDPTSYSQKDIDEMLAYHAGLHFFPDASGSIKARFDIFGNEITTYPGESLFPLRHYLDKGKDNKDFMFLKEIDALPSALTDWKLKDDEGIYVDDQDIPVSFQRKYKVLASKNFQKLVAEIRTDYESMSEKDKRAYAKEDYRAYYGKKVSRAQFEIKLAMTRAKLLAKEELEDEVERFIKR
ncbi:hypothetical protein AWW68_18850 [Roseivirga spongicola]|uniref:Uncharacterized protein n=1 Tax=Roseivirga spongicola TaxID=333140 RepID=A0A150XDW5_9BACT|nr:hypothetical protein [Roseivirga spongicola]KYG76917.1 hypothetical protein AWW68_18850 [Roseivirga spongicola]